MFRRERHGTRLAVVVLGIIVLGGEEGVQAAVVHPLLAAEHTAGMFGDLPPVTG